MRKNIYYEWSLAKTIKILFAKANNTESTADAK